MIRGLGIAGLVAVLGFGAWWLLAGSGVQDWAMAGQRQFQSDLAKVLRALKSGESGALAALIGVAFGYGLLHAIGPGHGKFVIGGYGVARTVPMGRLAGIALAAALMQASVAVGLVYGALGVLGWTRAQVAGAEAEVFAPLGQVMMAAIGLWLVWRGARGLMRAMAPPVCAPKPPGLFRAYHAKPSAPEPCADCGQVHGVSLDDVMRAATWKDAVLVVLAIGVRPCSGALMLLVLTWQLGIGWAGVAGAFAMALGTGAVTVLVAALAVGVRQGGTRALPALARLRVFAPVLELSVGVLVVVVALLLGARGG